MPKLGAELLLHQPSYLNPLKDREMDLRGLSIPAIENLGVTNDQLESIDLSDNAIGSLSNLPKLLRLRHLLLANNPVSIITPSLGTQLPNLISLVLTGSSIKELKDLDPLANCKRLELLTLKDSPVTLLSHYRHWIIFRCRKVRVLDFEKVKDKERHRAKELFLEPDSKLLTPLALSISTTNPTKAPLINGTKNFIQGLSTLSGEKGRLLTEDERDRVKKAIETASTVEEVRRLKRQLDEGYVPAEKEVSRMGKDRGASGMDIDE